MEVGGLCGPGGHLEWSARAGACQRPWCPLMASQTCQEPHGMVGCRGQGWLGPSGALLDTGDDAVGPEGQDRQTVPGVASS